jgi:hypothetical protein
VASSSNCGHLASSSMLGVPSYTSK